MPTISIVIPAYNGERTILETIASVQQQTCSDFELIVINDGSTDSTLELLHNIQDPRLKIFSYENGGVTVARNRGLSHVTGEFVAFLDQDDLWTTDKLELQLAALQKNPEAGLAYSWTCNMDEQGENFFPGYQVTFEGNVYDQLLTENFIAQGSNPLIRKKAIEAVGEFDLGVDPCDDWDYWLRLAFEFTFVVVPKEQIFYRHSSSSLSSKSEVMYKGSISVLEKAFQSAPSKFQPLKNQCFANVYLYTAELYLRSANHIEDVNKSKKSIEKAIGLYPQILKNKRTLQVLRRIVKKWVLFYFSQWKLSFIQPPVQ